MQRVRARAAGGYLAGLSGTGLKSDGLGGWMANISGDRGVGWRRIDVGVEMSEVVRKAELGFLCSHLVRVG